MKIEEQKELLEKYSKHQLNLTPTMNIHQFKYFDELGKYFLDKIKELNHPILDEYEPILKAYKKQEVLSKTDDYTHITIFFLTGMLDDKCIEAIYGEPIRHSLFGEGFEDKRDYTYCSNMVKINDTIFHIGYDHRGTNIECEYDTSIDDLKLCFESLINLYIETVLK